MKLIIAEKPVWRRQSLPYLGQRRKKTDFLQEMAMSFLGVWGIWWGFPKPPPTGNSIKSGAMTAYRFCRRNGSTPLPLTRKSNSRP